MSDHGDNDVSTHGDNDASTEASIVSIDGREYDGRESDQANTPSRPRRPSKTFERLDSVLGLGAEWVLPEMSVCSGSQTGDVAGAPADPGKTPCVEHCWVASVYASWVCLSLVVGCLCGVVDVGFHKMVLGGIKWIRVTPAWYISSSLGWGWWPLVHYTTTTVVSAMLISKAREFMPGIAGGGFVNVKLCILEKAYIPLQVAVQRMVAASLYIGGGGPLGTEAPVLHVSSAVACAVYRVLSSLFPRSFPRDAMPQIVIVGCACGMAAAYSSPLGGTLQAMEEFLDSSRSQVAVAILAIGSVASVWTVRVITGHRELWTLHPAADAATTLHSWMIVSIPFGLVLGLLGSLVVSSTALLRERLKSRGVSPMRAMVASALVTSACGVIVHLITAREEHLCSPQEYLDFVHSRHDYHGEVIPDPGACKWGLGMEIWGMSTDALQLHMASDPPLPPAPIFVFCALKCVALVFAVASNGAGGAFTPALVLGGSFGAILHSVMRLCIYGELVDNPGEAEQYRTCIIMGMAGFFASVVRLPLCGTLISVEMVAYASLGDRGTNLCFPVVLCCMISYVTAVYFSPDTLFDIMLKQDGISRDAIMNSKSERLIVDRVSAGRDIDQDTVQSDNLSRVSC